VAGLRESTPSARVIFQAGSTVAVLVAVRATTSGIVLEGSNLGAGLVVGKRGRHAAVVDTTIAAVGELETARTVISLDALHALGGSEPKHSHEQKKSGEHRQGSGQARS